MIRNNTSYRKKIFFMFFCCLLALVLLIGRLGYLMLAKSAYYTNMATMLHERERDIKAARGMIVDRNGEVLATNKRVCTVSVIHSQIEDPDEVERVLCQKLMLSKEEVHKKIHKVTMIERIKSNVDKETGDEIRACHLKGVKVDEDFKRYYPYGELASKVLGFTGADNQGIIGLEVKYNDILEGKSGKILTMTDAKGVELDNMGERRQEPVDGKTLMLTIDRNIQEYATQIAKQAMEEKQADRVGMIVMNPKNGEIYAMVNVPEFDLNQPYQLPETVSANQPEKQDRLNQMWRNMCINDTYEPGSTFKIFTASAALEAGVVTMDDQFSCPGFVMVEDRKIRCHKTAGHGSEDFLHGIMNSCNPVFVNVGLRLGTDRFYQYFKQFELEQKTGIDLPGEASTILHKKENVGPVELATMSFGQSFQVTPIRLITTVSELINGGNKITPHFAKAVYEQDTLVGTFDYQNQTQVVSDKTSETMRFMLEKVVAEGSGKNAQIEGYRIGGKTATSQTLPRSAKKYISSFIGFAPANDPKVITLLVIHNPKGVYYGGTIAAPRVKKLYENVLPYLQIEQSEAL